MSASIPTTVEVTAAVSAEASKALSKLTRGIPWVLLLAVLGASIPIVVCMPLTSDTALFDLQARIALDGGVLYRDAVEPNFPGIVWIHMVVRSVIGWSSESLRILDLCTVAIASVLLLIAGRHTGKERMQRGTIAVPLLVIAMFYLSRNEWCHCQRDSWMLLPVSIAVCCRVHRHGVRGDDGSNPGETSGTRARRFAVLEGLAWGSAVWIKPHIAASIFAIAAYSLVASRHRRQQSRDALFVVTGVLVALIPGVVWLWYTSALTWFLDMQWNWNPEYLQAGAERRSAERVLNMLVRFHPWWMVHLIAAPVACMDLVQEIRHRLVENRKPIDPFLNPASSLFAVLYLSWFLQASIVQHAMDYIQVPPVILGILFLSSRRWSLAVEVRRLAVSLMVVLGLLTSRQLDASRLKLWESCFRSGSVPTVKQALAHGNLPNWDDLENVIEFLRHQGVRQGDVTSWNVHTIHVYHALDLKPSTRYPCISILKELFPSRASEIQRTVINCGQKFVVTHRTESATVSDEFPWNLPVVFRSGEIEVHEVQAVSGLEP